MDTDEPMFHVTQYLCNTNRLEPTMISYYREYQGSAAKPYGTRAYLDGTGHCTCPAFRFSKDIPATCKHVKDLAALAQRGEIAPETGEAGAGATIAAPSGRLAPAPDTPLKTARTRAMLADDLPGSCKLKDGSIRWDNLLSNYGRWIFEPKIDGWRLLIRVDAQTVTAWSRPRGAKDPGTKPLPEHLIAALRQMPDGVYDGEVFVPGGTSSDVNRGGMAKNKKLRLALFDMLETEGGDIKGWSWRERRTVLDAAVAVYVEAIEGQKPVIAACPYAAVSREGIQALFDGGLEGAMLKNPDAVYRANYRSSDWIKVKREATIDMQIVGYEDGERAGKPEPFGIIQLRAADGMPSSVKMKNATEMKKHQTRSRVGSWLVVKYTERTPPSVKYPQGRLRHPRYDHLKNEAD